MPPVRWAGNVGEGKREVAVPRMPSAGVGDGGNDISKESLAIDRLVSSHVACYEPKEWSQCLGFATGLGIGQLPNSMGLVAEIAASYDPART